MTIKVIKYTGISCTHPDKSLLLHDKIIQSLEKDDIVKLDFEGVVSMTFQCINLCFKPLQERIESGKILFYNILEPFNTKIEIALYGEN